ncbi:phosphatidylinositol:ceramide inositolphosphotransferase-like [Physcomitrium patens]|uniref:Sphingomyelin synthase-like domain-containing protein n=1 Tax=Physcomitrium patens TaxID=3218 RepID=A0A2K1IUT1_PHYPA|nr:phosphatidylinositol:ceramide inositolphosphotransferase-like [Physcomitrium patens]PNR33034.1 hypothetical protein PHYPA_024977 [Physcomitrium patens]|eukprot:XP_024357039.1 phosphatidylinositol:ceramide inositolphosphotransferase-like [Physcomitrella patens]
MGVMGLPTSVTREVSKVWKRGIIELSVEWALLMEHWKVILGGLLFQYVHGVGARIAHYQHHPGPLLHDAGFEYLPELGKQKAHISESLFTFVFVSFVLWSFHPFVFYNKRFYTALLWLRVLICLIICQFLRMSSFMVTQLPGPNYHCHEGQPTATLPPPESIKDVLLLNFPYGVIYGCGDLIFSSHMTFALTFFHTYLKYGTRQWMKFVAFLAMVAQSLLIIASHKHYSVDIVVAWFTVYFVFFFVDRKLVDAGINERVLSNGPPLLPMTARSGKDGRIREEKMSNGITENGSVEL